MSAAVWAGTPPRECQFCGSVLAKSFVDGRTKWGMWANMCDVCHDAVGVGLGTGRGQRYTREREGDEWQGAA